MNLWQHTGGVGSLVRMLPILLRKLFDELAAARGLVNETPFFGSGDGDFGSSSIPKETCRKLRVIGMKIKQELDITLWLDDYDSNTVLEHWATQRDNSSSYHKMIPGIVKYSLGTKPTTIETQSHCLLRS